MDQARWSVCGDEIRLARGASQLCKEDRHDAGLPRGDGLRSMRSRTTEGLRPSPRALRDAIHRNGHQDVVAEASTFPGDYPIDQNRGSEYFMV